MEKTDLELLESGITSLCSPFGTADFKWGVISGNGIKPFEAMLVVNSGAEKLGSTPGKDFAHEAYRVLRHLAWKYRAARSDADLLRLENALALVASWVKERPGVNPDDVDRVLECLKADRCGCDRCRYGV